MSTVRRGQLVVPFGVGAIVEIGQESYVCADLSLWSVEETVALDPSELQRLTDRQVRTPHGSAPFVRFPRWMFCPSCRAMHRLTPAKERQLAARGFTSPRCPQCRKTELTPMGFVQACTNGHIDEIDWIRWAHRHKQAAVGGQCAPGVAKLRFITTGARGGDWETLVIECDVCGARNSLEGLTTRPLPWKCRARQPWMDRDGPSCNARPSGHRRGDTNLYFPETRSAIDIVIEGAAPTAGLRQLIATELNTGAWQGMRDLFATFGVARMLERLRLKLSDLAAARGVTLTEMEEAFAAELEGRADESSDTFLGASIEQAAILAREWPVLARSTGLSTPRLIVQPARPAGDWPAGLTAAIERIAQIPRLREVRALLGYRRVDISGELVRLDSGSASSWLPGVEVWGEGVFLQLSESFMATWEAALSNDLRERAAAMAKRCSDDGRKGLTPTPRFIALHTLSHVLLRRMAFDAGYSSTALRERIYSSEGMAGILIYTADGDSEGSLGGLVRMGEPKRLARTLAAALNDAAWCSADPVCGETRRQGVGGLNGAACHACALVAETSCVHGNQLLDRHFLLRVGDGRMEHGLLDVPPLSGH